MKRSRLVCHLARVAPRGLALAALSGAALAAPADSNDPQAWQSSITLYAYAPSLHGDTAFPNGNAGPTLKVDAQRIVKGLNFAFMGLVAVRKGDWGAFGDVFHADVSDRVRAARAIMVPTIGVPATVTGDFKLGAKTTLLTMAGTYRVVDGPTDSVSMLFGARLYDSREQLRWDLSSSLTGPAALSGDSQVSKTQWNAIVGVSGHHRFGPDLRWFMPYYVDVGTGASRFTGQALAGVGYAFDGCEVTGTWRYIDYNFKSGSLISRMSFSGPALGLAWRF